MVTAGVATEEDVRRWERAFQEVEAAPVPPCCSPLLHRRRPPPGLWARGRRRAYNQGNNPATRRPPCPTTTPTLPRRSEPLLRQRWEEQYAAGGEQEADFTSLSGEEVAPLYDPLDHPDRDVAAQIGVPGQYPFTHGVYPSMYRGRPWTIRQFSGGNCETNLRYKYLIGQGGGGSLGRLRHAHPDRPRLRRPAVARRGRPLRRGRRLGGRHGGAVRRAAAGRADPR